MKIVYQCDNCHRVDKNRNYIFHCIECDKEICESCMFGWSTCKECARNHTQKELEERFNKE